MKKHSAFSLIELSIVVLIIGVLIAGVTQGTRLVKQARLRTARALTQSSPVVGLTGLLAWYETSSENSLTTSACTTSTQALAQNDADAIACWYDSNPQSLQSQRFDAAASTGTVRFYNNIFNGGIPAARFGLTSATDTTGTATSLAINTSLSALMVGSSYTIFVVEQKRSNLATGYFFGTTGGTACNTTTNPCFGYSANGTVYFGGNTVPLTFSAGAYSTPVTRIHAAMLDTVGVAVSGVPGKRYWLNGGAAAGDASDTSTSGFAATLTGISAPMLGLAVTNTYYYGDLAEVIIFNRALKAEERLAVEAYLGKKYAVTMAIS